MMLESATAQRLLQAAIVNYGQENLIFQNEISSD